MKAFRTKLLNIFVVDDRAAWITAEEARQRRVYFEIENIKTGPLCMVAMDLSVHDDFSAISYNIYDEALKMFYVHTDYYIPEMTLKKHPNKELYQRWVDNGYMKVCKGDVISYEMITNDMLAKSKTLRIVGVGYDPYKSQECVNILAAAGFREVLKAVPQTYGAFTSPVETFEYALRTEKVGLQDNPITWYCFGNAVLDHDRNENKKPVKVSDNRKIDGVITILITFYMFNNFER